LAASVIVVRLFSSREHAIARIFIERAKGLLVGLPFALDCRLLVGENLAGVLGLDRRDVFVLANPGVVDMLASNENDGRKSAWDEFRTAPQFERAHQVTAEEMKLLAMVATMGDVGSPRDFIFILITVRHALDR
jgi:hypothetical protein